jgi:hypothetical protein
MLGMIPQQAETDVFSILIQRPRSEPSIDVLAEYRSEIMELLQPDPDPALPWLQPDDPWVKAIRDLDKQPPGVPAR